MKKHHDDEPNLFVMALAVTLAALATVAIEVMSSSKPAKKKRPAHLRVVRGRKGGK